MQAEVPPQQVIDVPNKEDEQFFPLQSQFSRVPLLKKASYPFLALSVSQIFIGAYLNTIQASFFPISLLFSGLLSSALLGAALYWTHTSQKTEEKMNSLTESAHLRDSIPNLLVLFLATIKMATVLLHAQAYLINTPGFGFPEGSSSLADAFFVFEVTLFFFSAFAMSVAFKAIKQAGRLNSSSVFLFNTLMLSASMALYLNVSRNTSSESFFRLQSLSEHNSFTSLLVFGLLGTLLSVPVWIVTHRRWRAGPWALAVILLTMSLPLLMYSFSIKGQARNTYIAYKDSIDVENLKIRSASIPALEVEAYRSLDRYPSSYYNGIPIIGQDGQIEHFLPSESVGIYSQLYISELLETSTWCIITALTMTLTAVSLLHSIGSNQNSSEERKSPRNYKWLALMALAGVSMSLMYGFHPDYSALSQATTEDQVDSEIMTTWSLGGLFNKAADSTSAFDKVKNDLSLGSNSTLGAFNSLRDTLTGNANNTLGVIDQLKNDALKKGLQSLGFDNSVAAKIPQLVTFKTYRYLISTIDVSSRNVSLVKQGLYSETYQDFLNSLDANKAEYAVVHAPVNGQDKVIGVVWVPKTAPKDATDTLLQYYAPNFTNSTNLQGRLGFPVIVASTLDQLQPANLANSVNSLALLYSVDENGFTELWSFGEIFSKATGGAFDKVKADVTAGANSGLDVFNKARGDAASGVSTGFNSSFGAFDQYKNDLVKGASSSLGFENNVALKITQLVTFKSYRYLITTVNPQTKNISLVKEGAPSQTYQDFLNSLDSNQAEFAVVRAPVSGQEKVIGVVWAPPSAPKDATDLLLQFYAPNISKSNPLSKFGYPVIIANSLDQLQVEKLAGSIQAQSSPPLDALKAPNAVRPPLDEFKAPNAVRPPLDEFKAPNAVRPPLDEFKAPNALAPPLDEFKAPNAVRPPLDALKAPNAVRPPLDEFKAPNAVRPPLDEFKAPNAVRPPLDEFKAPNAVRPPLDEFKAPNALAPPLDEFKAPNAVRPPLDALKAPNAVRPPLDEFKAPNALAPPLDEFKAPNALAPPFDELKAPNAVRPPLEDW